MVRISAQASPFGFRLLFAAAALAGFNGWWWDAGSAAAMSAAAASGTVVGVLAVNWWLLPMANRAFSRWLIIGSGALGAHLLGLWLAGRVAQQAGSPSPRSLGQLLALAVFGAAVTLLAARLLSIVDSHRASSAEVDWLTEAALSARSEGVAELRLRRATLRYQVSDELKGLVEELHRLADGAGQAQATELSELVDARLAQVDARLEPPAGISLPARELSSPSNWDWGLPPRITLMQISRLPALLVAAPVVPFVLLREEYWWPAALGALATGALLSGLWWLLARSAAQGEQRLPLSLLLAAGGQAALCALGLQWLAQMDGVTIRDYLSMAVALPAMVGLLSSLAGAVSVRGLQLEEQIAAADLVLQESLTLVRQENWRGMRRLRQALSGRAQSAVYAALLQIRQGGSSASSAEKALLDIDKALGDSESEVAAHYDLATGLEGLAGLWRGTCELHYELEPEASVLLEQYPLTAECLEALVQEAAAVAVHRSFARRLVVSLRHRAGLLLVDLVDDGVGLLDHDAREGAYGLFDELCLEWAIENTSRGTVLQATVPLSH